MKKSLQLTILVLTGSLAFLFFINFLVHLLFYIVDGSLMKFASPIWIGLNGLMILLPGIFVLTERWGRGRVSH